MFGIYLDFLQGNQISYIKRVIVTLKEKDVFKIVDNFTLILLFILGFNIYAIKRMRFNTF
jgi:hypothetical protein